MLGSKVIDMAYRSLAQAASDLERTGQLVRIDHPVDADLEMAEIHRRVSHNTTPMNIVRNVASREAAVRT